MRQYTEFLRSRVTPKQMEQIAADAEVYGKSICGYVRDRLTGKRIKSKSDQQMLNELRRIGGLIKHQGASTEIVDALERLRKSLKHE